MTVTNNLETDQRVNKVATTLQKMGFRVMVIGCNNKPCHYYNPGYATKRMNVIFKKGILFYAEINIRIFCLLLFSHFDIYVSNDTDVILPNLIVSKIKKRIWVADLHELFPEVPEVTNRKFVKWVWTKIEDITFPHITNGYTVCQSIADYYKKKYSINLKVVRNIPMFHPYCKSTSPFHFGKKVILYQGAVNVGRGIEWIMDAMQYINDAVFVIVGTGDLYNTLKNKSHQDQYKDKVFFLGAIPYKQLSSYTTNANLGVCLLRRQGLSYYYSLPNRVFDFMQAHVPILATGFPEISRIINEAHTGLTINTEDPQKIAQVIEYMLRQNIDHDIYATAAQKYTWENEEKVLYSIYSKFL